ncbi:hypothetical protein B5S29_g5107 [[Candida] boidinii]|nr:hypothetical protein B5S29_g5107 [[Candida] boidinii]
MSDEFFYGEDLRRFPELRNVPILTYQRDRVNANPQYNYHPEESNNDTIDYQFETSSDLSQSRRKYGNFAIIDWEYEYAIFSKFSQLRKDSTSKFRQFIHTNSKWAILIISSLIMGFFSIFIDFFSIWLHDFKYGYCRDNFLHCKIQCKNWENWSVKIFSFLNPLSFFHKINVFIIVLIISLIFVTIGFLFYSKRNPYSNHQDISDMKLILSGFVIKDFFNVNLIFSKIIGLVTIISSGLWLGTDGPLVHISGGVCDFVMNWIPYINGNEAIKRELLSSFVSVGIGIAFNAPIGGVLFELEQIQSFFPIDKMMWNSFVCSMISITVVQTFHPFKQFLVNQPFFIGIEENWVFIELLPFILVALINGSLGTLFKRLNIYCCKVRNSFNNNNNNNSSINAKNLKLVELFSLTVVTIILTYLFTMSSLPLNEILTILYTDCQFLNKNSSSSSSSSGNSTETSKNPLISIFNEEIKHSLCKYSQLNNEEDMTKFPIKLVSILFFISVESFLLSAYSYGCNIPGGVLFPSLVIGGLVGRIFGEIEQYIQIKAIGVDTLGKCFVKNEGMKIAASSLQCIKISPASYAVVGSASFLASITNMSIAVVVLVFEMTGALTYVLPIMIGVLVSRSFSNFLLDKSIYELWLTSIFNRPYLINGVVEKMTNPELSKISCDKIITKLDDLVVIYEEDKLTLADISKLINANNENNDNNNNAINNNNNIQDDHDGDATAHYCYPVLESKREPKLLGYVSYFELNNRLKTIKTEGIVPMDTRATFTSTESIDGYHSFSSLLYKDQQVCHSKLSILTIYEIFDKLKIQIIFVCFNCEGNYLKGIISQRDIIQIVNGERKVSI